MNFIGQKNIIKELDFLLIRMRDYQENFNIMFRAASGMGKTTLALVCLSFLGMESAFYYIGEVEGITPSFKSDIRFHVVDEAHVIKNPEFLYPLLDSKEYSFFVLTNESGTLKEPLINRCIPFIFQPYTRDEIREMVENYLTRFNLSEEILNEITDRVRNNPRIAKIICQRLTYIFQSYLIPQDLSELENIMEGIMDIREGGKTRLDHIYLEFLRNVGTASLDTISSGTGIDKATIRREIEPLLLYNREINISSKGRSIND